MTTAESRVRRSWQVQARTEHRWIPAGTRDAERIARARLADLRRLNPYMTFRLVEIVDVQTVEVVDPAPTADPEHVAPVTTWLDPMQDPTWNIFRDVIEARTAAWRRSGELVAVEMSQETVDDLVRSTPPMKTVDKIMGLPIIVNDSLSRGRVVGRPKDPTADRPVIDPEQTP